MRSSGGRRRRSSPRTPPADAGAARFHQVSSVDQLTYVGHATVLLRLEGTSILTDPLLGKWLGPLRRHGPKPDAGLPETSDLVLISHLHRDHLDLASLRRLPPSTPLIVPRGGVRWASKGGAQQVREMTRGETISIDGIEVTAVPAVHDGYRDFHRGTEIEPLGYVIGAAGRTVYFAGDTDLFPEMSDLGPIDLALLPIWGWGSSVGTGHLDPERAAMALPLIRPRLAVPIHWGTFYPVGLRRFRPEPLAEPPLEFARQAARRAPEVEVRVLEPGSETSLENP
jgi:L-ascorbate metabolism protein UlaG (beta-lactamase superfamily)